jgi:hypothetical protein
MRPQTHPHASRPFSPLSLDSHHCSPVIRVTSGAAQTLRHLVALAVLLSLAPGKLFAQDAPQTMQGESQNVRHSGQNAQDQQSGYGQQPYPTSGPVYPQNGDGQTQPPAEPLNAEQLEQLVAPIALYPDTLVAQVLAASTYPTQVGDAAHWRLAQGYASPDQIAAGADAQNWDPSLKALTAFPQVLSQMDRNLQWTTDLGNAYFNQPQDVLHVVQVMRRRAQAAGNLQSTQQEAVSYDQGNIELAPVNPQLVYVPTYDPWSVYGRPVSPYPGFSLLGTLGSFFSSSFGSPAVNFGLGIAMTAFSHTPWGWLAWGLNWLSQSVLFNYSNYYSQSTTVADWGFGHGGGRLGNGYNSARGQGFVPRPVVGYRRPGGGGGTALGRGFVPRPPESYSRQGGGSGATSGRGFVPRPPVRYAENRAEDGFNAAHRQESVPRPPLTYNHFQSPGSMRQQYGRPDHGSRLDSGIRAGYDSRTSAAYRSPQRMHRAPNGALQSTNFRSRSSGKAAHSGGGFHLFGGGHTPKSFSRGRNFSSRHSGGGGHSMGHSSGRHHH